LSSESASAASPLAWPSRCGRWRGRIPSAVALLEQALELHGEGRMRLERARTCIELGLAYRRRGQRRAARAVLERGADLAFHCQAAPLLEQARVELRILGARPRRMAFSGVESLTASERRAADLAAQSATNREIAEQLFVTVKTVESRLGSVYRKLGIATRREFAAALREPSALVAEPEYP
jgi:DNA-binding CsgD family transcriptional regulator